MLPHVMQQVAKVSCALEAEFRDVQEFEFTIQDGTLYLLQTRTAKRMAREPQLHHSRAEIFRRQYAVSGCEHRVHNCRSAKTPGGEAACLSG